MADYQAKDGGEGWWVAEGGMITVEENVQDTGITVSISQASSKASAVVCVHVWSHACAHVSLRTRALGAA